MKKITALLAGIALFASVSSAKADEDRIITFEELPSTAQQFVKTHFADSKVAYVKMDTELIGMDYKVIFADGCKIEFARDGEWTEVNCKTKAVPAGVVPQQIRDFVVANHPGQKIFSIDRDKRDYEIKLSGGLELKFDKKFKLIGIDD